MKEQEQEENNNRDEFSCHLKLKSRVLNTRDIQGHGSGEPQPFSRKRKSNQKGRADMDVLGLDTHTSRNKREKMATDRMVPSPTNKRTKLGKEMKPSAERTSRWVCGQTQEQPACPGAAPIEAGAIENIDTAREEEPKATERDRTSRELQLELDEEMKSLSKGTSGWHYDPEQAQPEWPRAVPFGWGDIKNPFGQTEEEERTSNPSRPRPITQLGDVEFYEELKSEAQSFGWLDEMSQRVPHWSSEWRNVPDPDTAREEEPKATERDRTSRELQLELDEEMKSLSKGTSGWYYDPEQAQPEWPRDAPFGWGDIKNPFSVVNSDQSTSKSPRKPMKSEQTRLRDPIEGQLELHNEMKSTTWKTSALRYDPTKEEPDWSRDAPFQNVSKPWHYPY